MGNRLEAWLNVPAIMKTREGNLEGTLKYGIREPIKPSTTPLVECEVGSKEEIGEEQADYWFVNDDQSIKVRLVTYRIGDNILDGLARDTKTFRYMIRRI